MKKIIYLLITTFVLSLVTALPISAEEAIDDRIQVVIDLGIISGDGTGDYKLADNITRAEMATVVYQLKYGSTEAKASKQCFYDVPQNHWAAGYIEVLYSNNIISGDGTGYFRPNDNVTTAELYTMLLKIAGYSDYMSTLGTYPDNVVKAASGSGLNKNIGNIPGEVITREDAFVVLYNLLNIHVLTAVGSNDAGYTYTNGPIFMNDQLKVYKHRGTVDGAQNYANDGSYLPDGIVTIDGVRYRNEADITISDMGMYGDFYYGYDEDGARIVLSFIPVKNDVVEISASQVISYAANKYTYKDGSKTKDIKLSSGKNIYYNGNVVLGEYYTVVKPVFDVNGDPVIDDLTGLQKTEKVETSYMEPAYGKIKFIDNNADKVYDTVMIEEYQNMFCISSSESNESIYGTINGVKQTVMLDGLEEYEVKTLDGKKANLRSIPENSLIMLQYYNENTYLNITICNKVVTGVIEAIDYNDYGEKLVKINGKDYVVAESNDGSIDNFNAGTAIIAHLDSYGNVAAIEKDIQLSGWKFGIVMEVDYEKKTNEATVNILTENGTIKTYTFYDRVRLDSDPVIYRPEDAEEILAYGDVIRYTYNAGNEILRIDTPTPKAVTDWDGFYPENDTFLERRSATSVKLKTTNQAIHKDDAIGEAMFYDADTICLQMPHASQVSKYSKDASYGSFDMSNLTHNGYYTMALYNTDADDITAELVVRQYYNGTMSQSATSMIIDSVTQVLDEDDEIVYQISGIYSGQKVAYTRTSNKYDNTHTLQRGDIVKLGVKDNEIINMTLIHSINVNTTKDELDATTTQYANMNAGGYDDWEHPSKYEYGYIEKIQGSNLVFKRGTPESEDAYNFFNGDYFYAVYLYDESNDEIVSMASLKDIKTREQYPNSYDTIIIGSQSGNGTEIFIIRK